MAALQKCYTVTIHKDHMITSAVVNYSSYVQELCCCVSSGYS